MSGHPPGLFPEESGTAAWISEQFRGYIVSGRLGRGERLPTVRQAARDLGVAPGTVARAYKMLERDGLIVTRGAAGTRVADTPSVLPGALVADIRALVARARGDGVSEEDVVSAIRSVWATNT
ncbi:GntR family transcriptional regulator [Agromyces sp. SYSU K20354]|uniref:GntR family transcriptional regulator n=1 Tax=Agromyces cavernae TaxID=2898659 RepID=UPI001E4F90DF|nr:GntR family transcriptional regulator [Agromyces cavernae]MCD2441988.1 GntR family transcriptional regulator [Agromyces cavernae]